MNFNFILTTVLYIYIYIYIYQIKHETHVTFKYKNDDKEIRFLVVGKEKENDFFDIWMLLQRAMRSRKIGRKC